MIGCCRVMSTVSRRGVSTWQRERALAWERKNKGVRARKTRLNLRAYFFPSLLTPIILRYEIHIYFSLLG